MARSFPGSIGNYINTPFVNNFFTFISMSVWINLAVQPGASSQFSIVEGTDASDNRNFSLDYRDVTGVKNIELATRVVATYGEMRVATTLTTGTWYNIVATANWTTNPWITAIYLNGVAQSISVTGATTGTPDTATSGPFIGTHVNLSAWFNGSIADVAIWNVVLTQTEVLALSQGVRPYRIRNPSLKQWWPLDGLQSPEPELTRSRNNGTVNGAVPKAFGPPTTLFTPYSPQVNSMPLILPASGLGWIINRRNKLRNK